MALWAGPLGPGSLWAQGTCATVARLGTHPLVSRGWAYRDDVDRAQRRRSWARAVFAIVGRPGLWPTALRQLVRASRPGWWRRPPFLPRPDPAYLRFRLETQYGSDGAPAPDDLVTYLEWCRAEASANTAAAGSTRR